MAFFAGSLGCKAHLETNGWAIRDGKWHRFVDGRSACRGDDGPRYILTNTYLKLHPMPVGENKVCARCAKPPKVRKQPAPRRRK